LHDVMVLGTGLEPARPRGH